MWIFGHDIAENGGTVVGRAVPCVDKNRKMKGFGEFKGGLVGGIGDRYHVIVRQEFKADAIGDPFADFRKIFLDLIGIVWIDGAVETKDVRILFGGCESGILSDMGRRPKGEVMGETEFRDVGTAHERDHFVFVRRGEIDGVVFAHVAVHIVDGAGFDDALFPEFVNELGVLADE